MLERQLRASDRQTSPAVPTGFGELLGRKLRGPDGKVRRKYVHLLADRVEVGDREIYITGRNTALERTVIASQTPGTMVFKAERIWRARNDSNVRPSDS